MTARNTIMGPVDIRAAKEWDMEQSERIHMPPREVIRHVRVAEQVADISI